jgi:hypothetical protein
MPRRNSPSKVARDAKGKARKGTDAQRAERARLEAEMKAAGEGSGETPSDEAVDEVQSLQWRMRLYVHYYLTESQGDGPDAARRAGYPHPAVASSRLLKNRNVAAAIAARTEAALSSDEILGRLADMATYDIGDCLDPVTGQVDVGKLIASGKTHLIHAIEPTANGVKVKLASHRDALELLGKFRKLFVERLSFEGFDPATMTTEQLRAFVAAGKGKQGP